MDWTALMIADEDSMFYLVANAESQDGMPCNWLMNPPRAVHHDLKTAEAEAVRLAQKTGKRFFIVQAIAYVEVIDSVPRWTEVEK